MIDDSEVDDDTLLDYDEMCSLYEETMVNIEEGEVVKGTIIKITENEVLIDVGYKSEGTIPLEEFPDPSDLVIGDTIEVFIDDKSRGNFKPANLDSWDDCYFKIADINKTGDVKVKFISKNNESKMDNIFWTIPSQEL